MCLLIVTKRLLPWWSATEDKSGRAYKTRGLGSSERACFSLSYTVNTLQATPLSVHRAKPQEFPLWFSLSLPFLFQSLSLIPAFSDRPMGDAAGRTTTEPAGISFLFLSLLSDIPRKTSPPLLLSLFFLTQTPISVASEAALNIGVNVMKLWHWSVMMKGKRGLLEVCLLMNSLASLSLLILHSLPLSVQSCMQGLCRTLAGIVGDTWANLALIS